MNAELFKAMNELRNQVAHGEPNHSVGINHYPNELANRCVETILNPDGLTIS